MLLLFREIAGLVGREARRRLGGPGLARSCRGPLARHGTKRLWRWSAQRKHSSRASERRGVRGGGGDCSSCQALYVVDHILIMEEEARDDVCLLGSRRVIRKQGGDGGGLVPPWHSVLGGEALEQLLEGHGRGDLHLRRWHTFGITTWHCHPSLPTLATHRFSAKGMHSLLPFPGLHAARPSLCALTQPRSLLSAIAQTYRVIRGGGCICSPSFDCPWRRRY